MNTGNDTTDRTVRNSKENANKEITHTNRDEAVVYLNDFDGDYHVEQDDEIDQTEIRDYKQR